MAEDLATRRFRVRNLDCASCAAKIEQGLQQLEEVQEATLDFAGLILKIRAHDMQHIVETVRRIDPAVELIPEEKAPSRSLDVLHYAFLIMRCLQYPALPQTHALDFSKLRPRFLPLTLNIYSKNLRFFPGTAIFI